MLDNSPQRFRPVFLKGVLKPLSGNPRNVKRDFNIVRIGRFWRIQHVLTQKICEIS